MLEVGVIFKDVPVFGYNFANSAMFMAIRCDECMLEVLILDVLPICSCRFGFGLNAGFLGQTFCSSIGPFNNGLRVSLFF